MEVPVNKGTVTSLSSIFSPDEALKAVKRVQDTIDDKHKQLVHVREFIADNTNLVNLVNQLPDVLHHDIMVPFGKVAFFPGRLIHTNEFMVLLGEGYYAERTSKQTIEILKRRGKLLESQVESIKAMVQDLKAEASFFDTTASEAAEGLVEIREDYNEEDFSERVSQKDSSSSVKSDNNKVLVEDEEYARMMSRFDELENEELADEGDEDEHEVKDELATENYEVPFEDEEEVNCRRFDEVSLDKLLDNGSKLKPAEKAMKLPEVNEKVQETSAPKHKTPATTTTSQAENNCLKAFTCTIVERTDNLPVNPREQNTASAQNHSSQPSRPVSKFKMQRRSS